MYVCKYISECLSVCIHTHTESMEDTLALKHSQGLECTLLSNALHVRSISISFQTYLPFIHVHSHNTLQLSEITLSSTYKDKTSLMLDNLCVYVRVRVRVCVCFSIVFLNLLPPLSQGLVWAHTHTSTYFKQIWTNLKT